MMKRALAQIVSERFTAIEEMEKCVAKESVLEFVFWYLFAEIALEHVPWVYALWGRTARRYHRRGSTCELVDIPSSHSEFCFW